MRFWGRLSLRKKIALLTVLGLLLVAGVFGVLAVRAANQAIETMLQERVTAAQLMADSLDGTVRRALDELDKTGEFVGNPKQHGDPASRLETRIEALETTYSALALAVNSAYLTDENGEVIWSKPEPADKKRIDFSCFPDIAHVIADDGTTMSGLVPAPSTNAPVVFLVSFIEAEDRAFSHVLVVAIEPALSGFGGFVRPLRLGKTGYVEIVDQNGVVLVRTEPGLEPAPFEISNHGGYFAALIAAGAPTRGLCHTCHEAAKGVERRDVLAFVPLTEVSWGVVIRQSEEEALAPVRELRQNLLLSGLGLVLAVLVSMVVASRDAFVRLGRLTSASKRIADGDLSSPISPSHPDEIGELARAMDDMRVRLRASYGELEQRTRELSSLLSVSQTLTSSLDLPGLNAALEDTLDKTLEAMKADCGGILLLDEKGETLRYRVYHGSSPEDALGVSARLGEDMAGKVFRTGQPVFGGDISNDPRVANDPTLLPEEKPRAFACVPLRSNEKVIGAISVASRQADGFSARDIQFLEGVAAQVTIALENANLHQQVRHQDKIRGELLLEILSIQEDERRRIARELHDETSQSLASLVANLEAVAGMLPAAEDKVNARLRKAQSISISILDGIHKIINELRPTLLDDLGLVTAIRWLADSNLGSVGVKVRLDTVGKERRLPSEVEIALFRVVQEAISNIARHANAHNTALSLHFQKKAIQVSIQDDGKGFDVQEALSSKDRPRGLGLLGMKERIELVHGTLSIRSRIGSGTLISFQIPLSGSA